MKIVTLVENTTKSCDYIAEHGLSIYIETNKHKLLLDAGCSDALLHNAQALGIDLSLVDTLILSHGHYDHSGGIMHFAKLNPTAKIYMQKTATEDYYHGERYIGIDKQIASLPQVTLLDGDFQIDEELSLFTNITGKRFCPKSNLGLTKRVGTTDVQDLFDHEQCLVITQGHEKILLSGCAHNGILNLIDKFKEIHLTQPQIVISGFHMMKKTGEYTEEEISIIRQTAEELKQTDTKFYTGHCTGQEAYDMIKPIMGDRLEQLYTGFIIE